MAESLAHLSAALADRYRLEREVGQGGMATVYLAHDVRHDRKVALKVLRPELSAILGAERFLAEIKTTANLQHPHILPLFDSGEADGLVFYVMPYVEGESLRDRLAREKQLPVDEAIRIAREVADALDYAHRHGVIHRDIKPENILLHDGRALVADFGIALAAARSDGGTRMTETGMSLGTPHYMSPEQAMGEREITAKSDVYALGCVTYEMLTGEPPFTGPTAQAIIARVMTEEPRSLTIQRKSIPAARRGGGRHRAVEAAGGPVRDRGAVRRGADPARSGHGGHDRRAAGTSGIEGRATLPGAGPGAVGPRPPRARRRRVELARAPGSPGHVAGSTSRSATASPPRSESPSLALSPDGASLVVRDNVQNGVLWLKRRGALNAVRVAGTERSSHPVFSPDGQWVLFYADGRIKKIRPGEGGAVTLADSADATLGGATWLDDGTVVYVGPNLSELSRVSAAGGQSTVVSRDPALAGFGIGSPSALPGARGVLFTVCNSGCVTMRLHLLDLRTGRQRLLLDGVVAAGICRRGICSTSAAMAQRSRRRSTSRVSGSPVRRCRCSMACSRPTARRFWPGRPRVRWSTCRAPPRPTIWRRCG